MLIINKRYYPNKVNKTTEAQLFYSFNHHKWLPYQILGVKTIVHFDPQITEIWPAKLIVVLSVSEGVGY